ncbi:hypothetical protein F9278_19780 [Streptomyces phaeolivaceus]|uniref:Uncharacterized protein n=1 Tax=Streptomyces phaeolivaceus TaxID=2653200 RepID=A0A5P8K6A4_9ACTN|nr:hypothetical protein [Streptomyces phaeolivaceus]QFQ98079.1 hypothetical protein F9278_19780 [Streptomyces phaeolivaceus]
MGPQHSFSPPAADVLRARYAGRLPSSLEELAGQVHGRVELPPHAVWSGLRSYDLDRLRQRMSLYRIVLTEGQRADLVAFLDRDLLLAQWPDLRILISRHIREVWEDAFPEIVSGLEVAHAPRMCASGP